MSAFRQASLNRLVLVRLNGLSPIGDEMTAAVMGLGGLQDHPAGSELVRDREALSPRFVVSGWAARVRWLADGRRQIISFILPGDSVGLCERPQPLAMVPVVALTRVQTLDASPIQHALTSPGTWPGLAQASHIAASLDEAVLMDQVVRLGRQAAYERLAHLLLEPGHRQEQVGLGTAIQFPCPLTQEMIADALGLSIVHVNRTLQQMRREDLVDLKQGRARLLKRDLLKMIADWRVPQPSAWTG